jgi:hypothetical protein
MAAMTKTRILTPLAVVATAAAVLPATASAKRSHYCSPSGDVCYGVVKGSSPIKLQIVLQAKYFSRFRLCITGPHHERDCKHFRIHKLGHGEYGRTVSWPKNFPYRGKGTYRARFYAQGQQLGPKIKF